MKLVTTGQKVKWLCGKKTCNRFITLHCIFKRSLVRERFYFLTQSITPTGYLKRQKTQLFSQWIKEEIAEFERNTIRDFETIQLKEE